MATFDFKPEVIVELEPTQEGERAEEVVLEGKFCFYNPFLPTLFQIVTKLETETMLYLFNYNCIRRVTVRHPEGSTSIDAEFDRRFVQTPPTAVEENLDNAI